MLLATFCQDWSVFGWPVGTALAIGVAGALTTSGLRIPSPRLQLHLRLWLPMVMLACCLATRLRDWNSWLGFFYKCYYTQLDVAFIVSFAFGSGFVVSALRDRHRFVRSGGCLYVPAYVWLFIEAARYAVPKTCFGAGDKKHALQCATHRLLRGRACNRPPQFPFPQPHHDHRGHDQDMQQ